METQVSKFPEAIQRQIDEAEALEKQLYGQPVTTAPNIFTIFTIGSNNYTVQSFDGSWSTTHNGPMILYWASGQGSWFALKGGA